MCEFATQRSWGGDWFTHFMKGLNQSEKSDLDQKKNHLGSTTHKNSQSCRFWSTYVEVPNRIVYKLFEQLFARVLGSIPGRDTVMFVLGCSSSGWRWPWSSLSIEFYLNSFVARNNAIHKVLTDVEYRAVSDVFQNIDPPPPSPPSECVLPPHQRRRSKHSPGGEGDGWSIFWKTPAIGLASYNNLSAMLSVTSSVSQKAPLYKPVFRLGGSQQQGSWVSLWETPVCSRIFCFFVPEDYS